MKYARNDIPELADEYVLGLLETTEAAAMEAEMQRDTELSTAVAASRDRFLPLDSQAEPAIMNETLWQKIEANLPPQQAIAARQSPRIANDNRNGGWRAAAISAMAATLILAAGLGWSLTRIAEPMVVAVLVNERGDVQAVVEDFGNENANVRMLADFDVPADRTIQVWTLPSREMGPVSLGLIEGTRSALLDGPALPLPKSGQLYEITLEQAGGSPTGRPTGPILAKGLAKLPR